jgi:hypothetical protein
MADSANTTTISTSNTVEREWRPVPGFEGIYAVSDIGEVMRVCPGAGKAKEGHILSGGRNPKGYIAVGLCKAGKTKTWYIHTLVCEVWHGPKPSPLHQAAHSDDDKDNNSKDNLYWATPLENHADRRRNGGILVGERIGKSKLTEADVIEIRCLKATGQTNRQLGKQFRVAAHTISAINTGRTWGHVA